MRECEKAIRGQIEPDLNPQAVFSLNRTNYAGEFNQSARFIDGSVLDRFSRWRRPESAVAMDAIEGADFVVDSGGAYYVRMQRSYRDVRRRYRWKPFVIIGGDGSFLGMVPDGGGR